MDEEATTSPDSAEVFCPVCQQHTANLKWFELPIIVFLILIVAWNYEQYVACPDCMRRHLARRCLTALFISNVFWPVLLVWYGSQYFATFAHGSNVSSEMLLAYRTLTEQAPSNFEPKPSLIRLLVVLLILAAIVTVLIVTVH